MEDPNTAKQAQNDADQLQEQELAVETSPHALSFDQPEFDQLGKSMGYGNDGEGEGEAQELEELGDDGE